MPEDRTTMSMVGDHARRLHDDALTWTPTPRSEGVAAERDVYRAALEDICARTAWSAPAMYRVAEKALKQDRTTTSERPDVVTIWWCETCSSQGVEAMPARMDVYGGFRRITDAHEEAEPGCPTGHKRVRVRISEEQPDA